MRWLFIFFILCPLHAWANPPDFDRVASLRFNTVCSHCHEGQCSGRLSFSLGPEATFVHIRRYAGEVDNELAQQLDELLDLMKQECAFPPLKILDTREIVHQDVLDSYQDSYSGNYFMPLGNLETGKYRITLRFEQAIPLRVEVLNKWFDFVVDECSGCGCELFSETMEVDEATEHYLRIHSQDPIILEELQLSRVSDRETQ